MPKFDELLEKGRFKKSNFRPWNFSEELKKEDEKNAILYGSAVKKDSETTKQEKALPAEANHKQAGNQVETNQNRNKPLANCEQTVSKPLANRKQIVSKSLAAQEQTVSKPLAQPLADSLANRKQTVSKPLANTPFSMLVGLQRKIVILLYEQCLYSRSKTTNMISLEWFANKVKTTPGAVKNALWRLQEKCIISKVGFKSGRGGCSQYELKSSIYNDILHSETVSKPLANREQTVSKPLAQPLAQPLASLSSSSSNLNLDKTTTTKVGPRALPPEWSEINYTSLEHVGFGAGHIDQIFKRGELTPEQTQDSIDAFSFDLSRNDKLKEIKTTPIRYLMGKLGSGELYVPPPNYLSPEEESLKLYLEQKKKRQKAKEEMEKEASNFAFEEWIQELTSQQRKNALPNSLKNAGEMVQEAGLRTYFEKNVWSEKRSEILSA